MWDPLQEPPERGVFYCLGVVHHDEARRFQVAQTIQDAISLGIYGQGAELVAEYVGKGVQELVQAEILDVGCAAPEDASGVIPGHALRRHRGQDRFSYPALAREHHQRLPVEKRAGRPGEEPLPPPGWMAEDILADEAVLLHAEDLLLLHGDSARCRVVDDPGGGSFALQNRDIPRRCSCLDVGRQPSQRQKRHIERLGDGLSGSQDGVECLGKGDRCVHPNRLLHPQDRGNAALPQGCRDAAVFALGRLAGAQNDQLRIPGRGLQHQICQLLGGHGLLGPVFLLER